MWITAKGFERKFLWSKHEMMDIEIRALWFMCSIVHVLILIAVFCQPTKLKWRTRSRPFHGKQMPFKRRRMRNRMLHEIFKNT
jgi:hypothetical protein